MSAGACEVGSLLLRPGRVREAQATDPDEAIVQDLVTLAVRVARDAADGGTILAVLQEAVTAAGRRIVERAGPAIYHVISDLQDLVAPFRGVVDGLSEVDPVDPASAERAVLGLVDSLAQGLASLSVESVRAWTSRLVGAIEQDLGLTPQAVQDEIWALVDDLALRLERVAPEDDRALRANRVNVVLLLRRIRRRMFDRFRFPGVDADALAGIVFGQLRSDAIDEALRRIACQAKEAETGITVAQDILELVPFTGFGTRSVGAGEVPVPRDPPADGGGPDIEYLWYPTWLLGDTNRRTFGSNAEFWIDRRGGSAKVMRGDATLFASGTFDWMAVPVGPDDGLANAAANGDIRRYTFRISADAMEGLARHLGWIADALEALLHIYNPIGPGAEVYQGMVSVTDVLRFLWSTFTAAFKAGAKMPFEFWLIREQNWRRFGSVGGPLLASLPQVGVTVPGMFQKVHTNGSFWNFCKSLILNVLVHVLNLITAKALPSLGQNLLLSLLTVANTDFSKVTGTASGGGSGDPVAPDNRKAVDGIQAIPMFFIGQMLPSKSVVPPEYYGHLATGDSSQLPDWSVKMWLEYLFLAGAGFGIIGAVAAWVISQVYAAAWSQPVLPDFDVLGFSILKGVTNLGSSSGFRPGWFDLLTVFPLSFWLNLYATVENDTSGGTWNPPSGPDFSGYPSADTSPYRLPWASGKTVLCIQGNQGFFSHNYSNPGGPQVYAYDFMLDMGDEVLAARPGTVVDFFDWVPENEDRTASWLETTLSGDVDDAATTITVASASGFPATPFTVMVDAESMTVTAVSGTTWTVTRAASPKEHGDGTPVLFTSAPFAPGMSGTDSWNFVAIRHDAGDDSTGKHDLGPGGAAATTYAVYGHGKTGSVRQVFGDRGVAAAAIIGTHVTRGQPIMLADSTGVSFTDHVHIEVRMGPVPSTALPITRGTLGITLPFVFGEVGTRGKVGATSGVPTSRTWWESANARTP